MFLARNPAYVHAVRDSLQAGDGARAGGILDMVSDGLKFQAAQNQQEHPRQQRPQPNAPAAPRPLRRVGGGASGSSVDPGQMSMKD